MAYILMSGQDIRTLAVNVNAKQSQGFIPAGGVSYKDGTFYQFMAPTDIPDPSLYGIVMTQSDLDFAARAALMPGAPLGTMIQHKAYFIQAFGTAVSDSGMIQIPLAVANGGTGATTINAARANLALNRFNQIVPHVQLFIPQTHRVWARTCNWTRREDGAFTIPPPPAGYLSPSLRAVPGRLQRRLHALTSA